MEYNSHMKSWVIYSEGLDAPRRTMEKECIMSARHFLNNTHELWTIALIMGQKSCKICFQILWLTLYVPLRKILNFFINQDKMSLEGWRNLWMNHCKTFCKTKEVFQSKIKRKVNLPSSVPFHENRQESVSGKYYPFSLVCVYAVPDR